MMLHVNEVHEKPWGIHVSSNNLTNNGFATVFHLKAKMLTYNFQKLLYWKLLITFRSDSLALV